MLKMSQGSAATGAAFQDAESTAGQADRTHTLVMHVQMTPLVLNRVVTLLRRKTVNLRSLVMAATADPAVAQITVTMLVDAAGARRMRLNLEKLVEVLSVEDVRAERAVAREMALVRIQASPEARAAVAHLTERRLARVVDSDAASLIVEVAGTPGEVDEALASVRACGILEVARTSPVTLGAGPRTAEPANGAGPASTGPNGAGPASTGPNGAGPASTGPNGAGPASTGPNGAGANGAGANGAGANGAGANGGNANDAPGNGAAAASGPGITGLASAATGDRHEAAASRVCVEAA